MPTPVAAIRFSFSGRFSATEAMPLASAAWSIAGRVITGTTTAMKVSGSLSHVDALKAFNRALAATAAEEHS